MPLACGWGVGVVDGALLPPHPSDTHLHRSRVATALSLTACARVHRMHAPASLTKPTHAHHGGQDYLNGKKAFKLVNFTALTQSDFEDMWGFDYFSEEFADYVVDFYVRGPMWWSHRLLRSLVGLRGRPMGIPAW
jgi:hypothetical protein